MLVGEVQGLDIPRDEDGVWLLEWIAAEIALTLERKQAELRLQRVAGHDPLTRLPNRDLLWDRLHVALELAERNKVRLSLLFLDVDRFKQVNDTLGHVVGDSLLQEVAARLKLCVRRSDTVSRVGGDEFLVLLYDTPLPENGLLVAEKIREALNEPFELMGHRFSVSSSIGMAMYPDHGRDPQHLIHYADEAMYEAKKDGGNRVRLKPTEGS
ncbi:MAG: diguanylate cyclase domain-containing protein [Acidiferrobacter sp.]